jgi:hypothetical protein
MATKKKPVGGAAPEAAETRGARARAKSSSVKARTGASRKPAASRAAAKPGARAPKPSARKAAKPAAAPKATRKTAAPRAKPGARAGAAKSAAAKTKSVSRARGSRTAAVEAAEAPRAVPGLSEEDQIRAAKFLPRELPKRLFEEERFLFPESYGQNRIRLLVRDPEWIFAYWDVKPQALEDLAKSLGERALALSRLTLRVVDPVSGGSTDILLPAGARWWYVKTDAARRTYRAELGVTLPSGQFRKLAESNTVVTPRVGPSPEGAHRRMSYRSAGELAPAQAAAALEAERAADLAAEPWAAESVDGSSEATEPARSRAPRGGASDAFRPGGASDTFRR